MFFAAPCVISGLLLLSLPPAAADEVPNLPYDPATWPGCTFWYDNYGDMTCAETAAHYYIKLADMIKWNPRLSSNGGNCVGWTDYMSYCIDAFVAPLPTTTTPAPAARTSTTTTTKPKAPTSKPRPQPTWLARGCYLDDGSPPTIANRTTSVPGGDGAMTPDLCGATCWAAGFVFAGVERGNECWCGDSIRNEKLTDAATTCVQPCAGDASRTCGGDRRIEVFEGRPNSAASSLTATRTLAPPAVGTTQGSPAVPTSTAASNAARNLPHALAWLAWSRLQVHDMHS